MTKNLLFMGFGACIFSLTGCTTTESLTPTTTARMDQWQMLLDRDQVVEAQWAAIGSPRQDALMLDHSKPYEGKPSFRFYLSSDDNAETGFEAGVTKGRIELSRLYVTPGDLTHLSPEEYEVKKTINTLYQNGEGITDQASQMFYKFAIFVPEDIKPDAHAIFAQWHGLVQRTLVQNPQGEEQLLSEQGFYDLLKTTTFNKNVGYAKTAVFDDQGGITFTADKPNGWEVEQGGYPPLSFSITDGYFNVKVRSDKKRMSDKAERIYLDPNKLATLEVQRTEHKAGTIAYKEKLEQFPKNQWVTFEVSVLWSQYDQSGDILVRPGKLHIDRITFDTNNQKKVETLVDNATVEIGRNDVSGYYFKHGIYRVDGSETPVLWNLAGFRQGSTAAEVFEG